jgi:Rrf2 family protein
MLAVTKRTGYALIAMGHLAGLDTDEVASARQIAERFGVPTSLLMNVLKELTAAGYLESVRGAHGGYRLAQDPEQVTLEEFVTSLEGPIRLSACIRSGGKADPCDLMENCPIFDPVHKLNRKLRDFLSQVTLADLIGEPAALAALRGGES